MEKDLYEIIQRRKNNLLEEKNKGNGNVKDLSSGMSNSDIGEISHISQLKMENQISVLGNERETKEREKSAIIAEALDGVCICCHKNPISLDLIKKPFNLPICEECGNKCVEIRVKNNLSILEYLNLVIKNERIKEILI